MKQTISPYIIVGNRGNFQDSVLNNSHKGPVMVNTGPENRALSAPVAGAGKAGR